MVTINEQKVENAVKDIIDIHKKVDTDDMLMVSIEVDREEKKVRLVNWVDEGYTFITEEDVNAMIDGIKTNLNDNLYAPQNAVIICYQYLTERTHELFTIRRYELEREKK